MPAPAPNAYVPGAVDLPAADAALIARRERVLGPAYRLFYAHPLHIVRGEGVWLYDADGVAYLDAYNNVPSVGHGHPHVVAAIARQAAALNTHTRYLHGDIVAYAERLTATFPAELSQVMFTCTGSEANDLALRIAGAATGGTGVVVTRYAYHGVTAAISALSPALGAGMALGANVRVVDPPDVYRQGPAASEKFAAAVTAAFSDLRAHGHAPSALLVDTVFTSDGTFVEPVGVLAAAAEAARAAGALFIADEVQPGFGRTGSHLWGFARHGVVPDLVTLGKPMGNGHPIAGVVVRPEVLQPFAAQVRYFNTFGGNPVSIAAANAVLDVLEREALCANAAAIGARLRASCLELAERHEAIGDVRGAGLSFAVELVEDRATRSPATALAGRVVNALRERRILLSVSGPNQNILKIRPPLCFGAAHADQLVEALDGVLGEGR